MNEKNTEKELVVRKSNQLIEASYRFASINEIRMIQLLITKINAYDKDFAAYEVSVAEFAAIFGIKDSNLHADIRKTVQKLQDRKISIDEKNGDWLETRWLSSAKYRKGTGTIELRFDVNLKPYLLELKNRYTQFNVIEIVNFSSIYTIRFFEFVKENQFKANENGFFQINFEYVKLRKLFAIQDKEYKLFADFRKYAIEPAVTEINAKTNFAVEVSYGKTGRAITHITFDCTDKTKKKTAANVVKKSIKSEDVVDVKHREDEPAEIKRLMDFGLTYKTADMLLVKYGIDNVVRNMDYVDNRRKSGAIIINAKAYLAEAIKSDYGAQTVEEQNLRETPKDDGYEFIRKEEIDHLIGKTFVNPTKPELKLIVNNQNYLTELRKGETTGVMFKITRKFLDNIKNGVLIELGK